MRTEIALITIVNKMEMYKEFLDNLYTQKFVDYKLVPIYNCNQEYGSAGKAFNEAVQGLTSDFLVFLHPDIRFLDEMSLANIVTSIRMIGEFGVVGIAGAIPSGKRNREILTTIVQGKNAVPLGSPVKSIQEVQTLDECFFVIEQGYFQSHMFSENPGWHLYAVQYCLEAIKEGRKNYVVPARVWHLSDGKSLDYKYVLQLEQIIKYEKQNFEVICTTVKAWPTKGIWAKIYRKYYVVKQLLKKIFV